MIGSPLRLAARGVFGLHGALNGWIGRRPVVNDRGTALDRGTRLLLTLDRATAGAAKTPTEARRGAEWGVVLVETWPREVDTEDLVVAGRPARRYRPPGGADRVLLWLHGGGWVTGSLRTHDRLCRRLCAEGRWEVVALDYRLAPEHPFPAGLDDAVGAVRELGRVAIGGDSAGGNLAAAACQVLRDTGGPVPIAQVLVYPGVDTRLVTPSIARFAEGFMLTRDKIRWYLRQYAPPDPLDPRASPGLHPDLSRLPPALIVTAGFDPLRDEGEAYVQRLQSAGIPVVHLDAADLIHGFANMDGVLVAADREVARLARALADLQTS